MPAGLLRGIAAPPPEPSTGKTSIAAGLAGDLEAVIDAQAIAVGLRIRGLLDLPYLRPVERRSWRRAAIGLGRTITPGEDREETGVRPAGGAHQQQRTPDKGHQQQRGYPDAARSPRPDLAWRSRSTRPRIAGSAAARWGPVSIPQAGPPRQAPGRTVERGAACRIGAP